MRVASVLGYKTNKQLEAFYSKTDWAVGFPKSKYVYEYFKLAATDTRLLDKFELDEETRRVLLETLKSRFNQHPVKIRAFIEVTCYTYDGIDYVKHALKTGISCGTEAMPIKINLVTSPLYVVETSLLDTKVGLEFLNNACKKIRRTITGAGGTFVYRRKPEVVTAADYDDLAETTAENKFELGLDKFDDLGIL